MMGDGGRQELTLNEMASAKPRPETRRVNSDGEI